MVNTIKKLFGIKTYTLKIKKDKNGRARHYIYADGKIAKKEGITTLYLRS